ncbi:hypothetical protein C8Q77DRAFT_1228708 [Trametes polyzona]|nr:hypothetical protein C8Q77DRAFT_1228708 [Trametes polyzona]
MARSGPGSSQQRPHRAKGNYNPAEPVLKLKIPRRASAEVAQEREAAEARRQEILRRHEEDLRALAELEAKLKEQDEQAALDAARPPSQTLLTTVLKTTVNTRTSPPSQADGTAHGCITPTPPLGDTTKAGADYNGAHSSTIPTISDAGPQKSPRIAQRLKKTTRANFEALRATFVPSEKMNVGDSVKSSVDEMYTWAPSLLQAITATLPSENGSRARLKRKASKVNDENASRSTEPPQAVSKRAQKSIPSGLTVAAAARSPAWDPHITSRRSSILGAAPSNNRAPVSTPPGSTGTQSRQSPAAIDVHPGGYGDDEAPEQVEQDHRALQPVAERTQAVNECTLTHSSVQVTKVVAKPPRVKVKATNDVAIAKAPTRSASPSSGPAEPILDCAVESDIALPLDNSMHDTSDTYTIFQPVTTPLTKPPGRKWRMEDLVPILGPFIGSFKLRFIPNLIFFLGNLSSGPWHTYGVDLVGVMRTLAKEVWLQLKYIVIEPKQPFYKLAKQKLTDYRNSVATAAIEVVNRFMNSCRFRGSPQKRAEWVQWALSAEKWYPFRYGYVEERPNTAGKLRHTHPYQGKLVVQTFAHHLRRVQRRAHQVRDHPCNALALVTTAVERAIKLWESAKTSPSVPGGIPAHEYMASIINLTDEEWDKILQLADDYACGRADTDTNDDADSNDGNFDPHALPKSGGRAMLHDSDAEWDWSDDGGNRLDVELIHEDADEASTHKDGAEEAYHDDGQDSGHNDSELNGRRG